MTHPRELIWNQRPLYLRFVGLRIIYKWCRLNLLDAIYLQRAIRQSISLINSYENYR